MLQLPKIKLTNANILSGSVRFGSGRNKLVKLLIRSRNSERRTIRSLRISLLCDILDIAYRKSFIQTMHSRVKSYRHFDSVSCAYV